MDMVIEGENYEMVLHLELMGLTEWEAVCEVMEIPESVNFVVNTLGSSSSPREGFRVIFL